MPSEGKITSERDKPSTILNFPFLNPQTGPIAVQGAEKGDCLAVQGPVPVVVGSPNAAFSQKPKASASIGTTTSPSAVTASLIGAVGSRP